LLIAKSPRPNITLEEKKECMEIKIPHESGFYKLYPDQQCTSFRNHALIQILGGHPLSICLAAPMLLNLSLGELFKQLLR
jgi:hypothetical protein